MAPPDKKQKTEEAAVETPAEKDVEMKDEEKKEDVKVPEPPKEQEGDAPAAKGPKISETPQFLVSDTTLNLLQSSNGNVLMSLTEGGIQHFIAGARGNVGVKSGRYAFEVKVLQLVNTAEGASNRATAPRNVVRVGFSTVGSDLILGETEDSICFDTEGMSIFNKVRTRGSQKISRDDVVTVLLNLDKASPNANTISLFKDGVRACQPIALPENLKGKALFPHVSFKGVSVHVNFGPHQLAPLPFKIRMVQDAAKADAEVSKAEEPEKGKYNVIFPTSLPDEGSFQWLDLFLAQNKQYTELSDRKILDWAVKSGLKAPKQQGAKASNDKPDPAFQVRELDDASMRRAVYMVAPMQSRHYVVMEVKGNLVKEERKELLKRFDRPHFKKVAQVLLGDPDAAFKKRTHELILKDKQEASDKEFQAKKLEEKRKKQFEKRQKELAKAKKKQEKAKLKAAAEAKKKIEEIQKKAVAEKAKAAAKAAGKEEGEEKKEDETAEEKKEEEKVEEVEDSEEEEEAKEEEEKDEPPPKVELTAEDKKNFRLTDIPDLSALSMSSGFTKFSIPEKDEGFDEVTFVWNKGAKAKDYLQQWVLDRKTTTRVEDLQPGQWFQQRWRDWQAAYKLWHAKVDERKNALSKKAAAKAAKEAKKKAAAIKKAAEEAKAAKEKEEGKTEEKKDGEEKKEEKPVEEEKEEEEEEEEEHIDFANLDVFGIEDVCDLGSGMPLFMEFKHEDWSMMALRFELHLLGHAFRRDVEDAERPGIHADHIGFYYQKYYKRQLNPKDYGVDSFQELINLVNDSVFLTAKNVLENLVEGELENMQVFALLTEEARRHRKLQIDLGKESAVLRLTQPHWKQGGGKWKSGGGGGHQRHGGGQQQEQKWPQPSYGKAQQDQGKSGGRSQPYGGGSQDKGSQDKGGGKGSSNGGGKQTSSGGGKGWQDNSGKGSGKSSYGKKSGGKY